MLSDKFRHFNISDLVLCFIFFGRQLIPLETLHVLVEVEDVFVIDLVLDLLWDSNLCKNQDRHIRGKKKLKFSA